jgi:hypothetical protein
MTDSIFHSIAQSADFGTPSARKTGRDPRWPYVPVIVHEGTPKCPKGFTQQILGLAFETRVEAVDAASVHIEGLRVDLEAMLAEPRHRALREQYGLPRELSEVES